jgi:hypothetical protein
MRIKYRWQKHFFLHPRQYLWLPPSSGNIYLAWISNDTGHSNVLFAKSGHAGRTFSKTIFLSSPNTGKIMNANVFTAITGSNVYVTWWTNKGSSGDIFRPVFRTSYDNGNTLELQYNGNTLELQ